MDTNETTNTAATDAPKKRANSLYLFSEQDGALVWDFGTALGKITLDIDKASASARHFILKYGAKQWANDGGAVEAGANGKVDPVAKFNGIRERAELLMSGCEASGLLRRGAGAGTFSYVTRALVRLATYQGHDVSTYDKANAFVKDLAENPKFEKLGFKGQVGKARTWLETKSATIAAAIQAIRDEEAAGAPEVDADALMEEMLKG